MMRELATMMLYLTGLILVLRAPYALGARASRPGWLAGTCGLIAIICLGFVVPVPTLDAAMGSMGYWNLLGATSTTLAFHFMYRAILIHTSKASPPYYGVFLGLGIVTYSVAFTMISGEQNRFTSVETFIAALIGQPWTAIYLSAYLSLVAIIAALSLGAILSSSKRSKIFNAGFSLVVLGNTVDVILLWMQHLNVVIAPLSTLLYSVYVAAFFSGAILLCVGFLRGSVRSLREYCTFLFYALRLRRVLGRAGLDKRPLVDVAREPKIACYQMLIHVRDLVTLKGFALNTPELNLTHKADALLIDSPLKSST
ncbi:hypothetical protein [Arthrobacter sp. Soil763]|uniref:hypothetical protein n=1 Tax=Arthrobacter sp. Soil763 TaxID=1736402 RepID=UPI0006F4114B|nr:hypothetical protein [Arthrobacter sp. Soil763]KRE76595.1 hypothetical protein ASG71_15775 [Arthrobacter sp. Soil763]